MLVALNQTHSRVHSVFSSKLEIQVFAFLLRVKVFLKSEWYASLLKPGLTVSSFLSTSLQ